MPSLIQSLRNRDIGFLRIIARLWGIELIASDIEKALSDLAKALVDPPLFTNIVTSLSSDSLSALGALVKADGKLPWVNFSRTFGEIRPAGSARRDREQIYLHPASVSEVLFFRGLLAKAFFDLPTGVQEFAYIPDDFLPLIHQVGIPMAPFVHSSTDFGNNVNIHGNSTESGTMSGPIGRIASQKECEKIILASDRLLDDATTLLAALRMGFALPNTVVPVTMVSKFLLAAKILTSSMIDDGSEGFTPQIEPVRQFLKASREDALGILVKAWEESESFNELRQVPGLICEGSWSNKPEITRKFLLSQIGMLPKNKWWSLPSFVFAIKENYPDFQRPAGDYDSWFIKRQFDGTYLRGFPFWDSVDGELIRYFITGPLFWLGQVELATRNGSNSISAFRTGRYKPHKQNESAAKLSVTSQGKIHIPRLLPRSDRYQIARFCQWENEKGDEYIYQVTIGSLNLAREQGLKTSQLLSLLAKNSAAQVPPAFIKAVKRWDQNGTEARLEVQTILKVSSPEVLDQLKKSKTGRFLGETLGPVAVVVKKGAQLKVLAALSELGLLGEVVQ
jgi:hypothetical protein